MAQDAPRSKTRLPSTPVAPSIDEAIERTWPSSPEPAGAKGTPLDVLLRVSGFFHRLDEQKRWREEFSRANIRAHAAPVQTAPPAQVQPRPKPAPGPPDLLKVLGYAALGIGAAVIAGKTVSALTERKQRQRQLALDAEGQADALSDLHATVARYQAQEARQRRHQRALAQAKPVLDTTALEPKLKSWVSDAVTQNFDQGKAVQHVHQHVQHVHPVTQVQQVIERAVPGPRGATGPQGKQGEPGKPGKKGDKGKQGPRGYQGNQGPSGRQGKRGPKGTRGQSGQAGRDGVAPLQGRQPKTSRGLFDD